MTCQPDPPKPCGMKSAWSWTSACFCTSPLKNHGPDGCSRETKVAEPLKSLSEGESSAPQCPRGLGRPIQPFGLHHAERCEEKTKEGEVPCLTKNMPPPSLQHLGRCLPKLQPGRVTASPNTRPKPRWLSRASHLKFRVDVVRSPLLPM